MLKFGVNVDASKRDLALAGGALSKSGYARTGLQMNIVTANGTLKGRYAWDGVGAGANGYSYDAAFTMILNAGLEWLPVLVNKASMNGPFAPPRTPDELARFEDFCAAATGRYGPLGTFWSDHPGLPRRPVTAWEVLNEENHRTYWQDKPSGTAYAHVLLAAEKGIKSLDPASKIIVGGLVWSGNEYTTTNYMGTDRFLREIVAEVGSDVFDGVGIHPYVSNHNQYARSIAKAAFTRIQYIAASIRNYCGIKLDGRPNKEIWITEFGWVSADTAWASTNEDTQAAQLAAFLVMVDANRDEYNIGPALWFSLRDQGSSRLGLVYGDYKPKKALDMLAQIAAREQ